MTGKGLQNTHHQFQENDINKPEIRDVGTGGHWGHVPPPKILQ